jgi:sugar phosphate isomerase/epimerase
MRRGDVHLSYCSNIHPAESWAQTRAVLEGPVARVKAIVAPDEAFGIGLRLSGVAARQLRAEGAPALRERLAAAGAYVFSLNGFPYGRFHDTPVKARVYRPDWREPARVQYTRDLIAVLADLLPDGVDGSISTVPGCFRAEADEAGVAAIAQNLLALVGPLHRLAQTRGIEICLALEPEPACMLETTAEAVRFFETHLLSAEAAAATGLEGAAADDAIRRHLGVCLDTCHAAVEFEDPRRCVAQLSGAGIRIAKLQATTGLRLPRVDAEAIAAIEAFADEVYLHQTVARRGDTLTRYDDLPEAIAAYRAGAAADEWRVHFHIPVFETHPAPFENTQSFLAACLPAAVAAGCRHVEVETYTWQVLPAEHRTLRLEDAIARELTWTQEHLP